MNARSTLNRALLCGAAILFAAACGDTNPQLPTDAESTVEQVDASNGDFAAALVVHNRRTPDLMDIEGVVGTGLAVDGNRPVIRVYTLHGNVAGIPGHVDQVPVQRVITGPIVAGDVNDPTTSERPAPNGFSIGHPDITAGTMGAIVRDGSNACFVLSNNHVLANSNDASIGDSSLQPGPYDGGSDPNDKIGTLADFEEIKFDGTHNKIDAAIAAISTADVTGSTPDYAYGAPGTSALSASVGMAVMKFGRTTGFTTGEVAETNVTVDVCYGGFPFCTKLARFVGQISITDGTFSDGGDSGSLIVRQSDKSPVGLLFAGSSTRTIANPIGDVLFAFGVSVDPSCGDGGSVEPPENQLPTADFTFTTDGLTAHFTDLSDDADGSIDSRSWDFGDGNTSIAQDPSHTYAAANTYTVTLTVTDNDGASDSASQDVTVFESTSDGISLSATGYKVRGLQKADLTWDGATSTDVDVFRNGTEVATTPNDKFYTDNINNRGSGTYTYKVCEAGTDTCSNESTVSFN